MSQELNGEYQQWILTEKIQDLYSHLSKRVQYEAKNVLERWRISMVNENLTNSALPSWLTIYASTSLVKPYNIKMLQEFQDKKIPDADKLVKLTLQHVDDDVKKCPSLPRSWNLTPLWDHKQNTVEYGRFKTSYLFQDKNDEFKTNWLRMAMRYSSLAPGGQQWGLTQKLGIALYEKFNICNIGFASPLNFQLQNVNVKEKNKVLFFSLFKDTDQFFGSHGSFFIMEGKRMIDYPGNWWINPPWTPCILELTANRIIEELKIATDQGVALEIHYLMPDWKDTEWYNTLSKSKYLKRELLKVKLQYDIEVIGQKIFKAPINSIYMVLSSNTLTSEYLDNVMYVHMNTYT